MKITQITRTIIEAEEGKLLCRKSDGMVYDKPVHLGYDYYDAGVALSNPKLMTPDDYEEIDMPADYEDNPIVNNFRRMERMLQLINEEKQMFSQRGLTAPELLKVKDLAPKWGEDIKEGDNVTKGLKFTYEGTLYAVVQDHTILAHYYPCEDTKYLYTEVTEDYDDDSLVIKESLDKAKKRKIDEITKHDTSTIVNSFYYGNGEYWLDRDTRVSVRSTAEIMKEMGKQTMTLWLGDVNVTLAPEQVLQMLAVLEIYALECYNTTAQHKSAVNNLATIEEVEAYDFRSGYPDKIHL